MSPQRVPKALPEEWVRQGATLRALREKSGLKVDQLATAMNISRSYLANIEAGRKALSPVLRARAADVLDVPQVAIARPELVEAKTA